MLGLQLIWRVFKLFQTKRSLLKKLIFSPTTMGFKYKLGFLISQFVFREQLLTVLMVLYKIIDRNRRLPSHILFVCLNLVFEHSFISQILLLIVTLIGFYSWALAKLWNDLAIRLFFILFRQDFLHLFKKDLILES